MARSDISQANKDHVAKFLREAALGKTVVGRARKQIGPERRHLYLMQLTILIDFVGKNLDEVVMSDMERFVEALDGDKIRSRRPQRKGQKLVVEPRPLSRRYCADIKITVRKFYMWLWGGNRRVPELVDWFDTSFELKDVPALTEADVGRMLDHCRTVQQRAIIQVLFDGGLRLGELLNVRLRHVWRRTVVPNDPMTVCYFVRVPFSKTLRRTVVLPMRDSTRALGLWLEKHPGRPVVLPDGTLDADDLSLQLFPMTGEAIRQMLRRVGKCALGRRVYPHLMRHTSATFWSNKVSYFKMCKRFGWTMVSKMPQRYIDRTGVDEEEIANIYFAKQKGESQRGADELLIETPEVQAEVKPVKGSLPRPQSMRSAS
ncbi:MAG: site-specific integrase [Nanoarchaeota archaeon]